MPAKDLAAFALERQRGGVHEDDGKVGEQIPPSGKQLLLDLVLNRARCQRRRIRLIGFVAFLAQPCHGTVEMMQRQALNAGDRVIGKPLLASTIGTADHDPMQDGGKHGSFGREFEAAVCRHLVEDRSAARLLPQPAKQQGRADPLAPQRLEFALRKIPCIQLAANLHRSGKPRDRRRQPLEPAPGQHDILAAQILDDPLLGLLALAHALDEVQVAVALDLLLAHKHALLASI